MSKRGRLIVFEGGEGTGKSTQARRLAEELSAVLTREPGGTGLGEQIRSVLLNSERGHVAPRAELLLMTAARAQHVAERIRPALLTGRDVVCDRYSGSTIAYQGYGRGISLDEVLSACVLAEDGVAADLTILLDIPVDIGFARLSSERDRIEDEDRMFHERVRNGFLALASANSDHWIVVDAIGSEEAVFELVKDAVVARLNVMGGR